MPTRLLFPAALLAACIVGAAAPSAVSQTPSPAQEPITLSGAGATFPAKLYTKWFEAYHRIDPAVQFTYDPSGSGAGQRLIIEQSVDFGASDGPMSDQALERAPSRILHVPTVAGAVVVSYNLPGVGALKFDGRTLAGIFEGRIISWNDPEILRQNAGVKLPDMDIVVVHRSEASGTSYVFSDYLSAVSPEWKARVGKGTTLNWPVGLGAEGGDGVARKVMETPGSIGFFELVYALDKQMTFAEIKNREGYYVQASLASVTAALATAAIPDDFRFSMVNASGRDSYPIASATWLLIYETPREPVRGRKLIEFLKWAETEGQKIAGQLSFAPLPENVRNRVLNVLGGLKS